MRSAVLPVLAILAAAAAAMPASAQDLETGSLVNRRKEVAIARPDAHAIRVGHALSRCLARKRAGTVRRFLDATTGAEGDRIEGELSREVSCSNLGSDSEIVTGARFFASSDVQRGMFAEAVLELFDQPVTLAPLPRVREYHSPWLAVSGRNVAVEEMAICVAETDPAAIQALIATEPESPAELGAVRRIMPSVSACLVNSVRLTASRVSMRAALAEALYHRVVDPALPAPATAPK